MSFNSEPTSGTWEHDLDVLIDEHPGRLPVVTRDILKAFLLRQFAFERQSSYTDGFKDGRTAGEETGWAAHRNYVRSYE